MSVRTLVSRPAQDGGWNSIPLFALTLEAFRTLVSMILDPRTVYSGWFRVIALHRLILNIKAVPYLPNKNEYKFDFVLNNLPVLTYSRMRSE